MEVAMYKEDFFKEINQVEVKSGTYVNKYPIFYREVSYISVFLLAPLSKLRDILPSKECIHFG